MSTTTNANNRRNLFIPLWKISIANNMRNKNEYKLLKRTKRKETKRNEKKCEKKTTIT